MSTIGRSSTLRSSSSAAVAAMIRRRVASARGPSARPVCATGRRRARRTAHVAPSPAIFLLSRSLHSPWA
jgi:hypothetical protein